MRFEAWRQDRRRPRAHDHVVYRCARIPRPSLRVRRRALLTQACALALLACGAEDEASAVPAEPPGYSAVARLPATVQAPGELDVPLPTDVPGYPGATFYMSGTTEQGQRFVSLLTPAPNAVVYSYYRGALWSLGWEIAQEDQEGRSFVLVARKAGRILSVRVDVTREGTEIALETAAEGLAAAGS